MNIKIIAVGKIKEKFMQQAIAEYEKRLKGYCSLSVVEIAAENILDEALSGKYKDMEAEKILPHIKSGSFVVTLEILGKSFSSEELALKIKELSNEGMNEVIFVIGGANGISQKISDIADLKLSFSKMTFTHQMIRVMLLEQIYRAFKINNNEPYHR